MSLVSPKGVKLYVGPWFYWLNQFPKEWDRCHPPITPDDIRDKNTPSLFSNNPTLLILHADSLSAPALEYLQENATNPNLSVALWDEKFDGRRGIYRSLKNAKALEEKKFQDNEEFYARELLKQWNLDEKLVSRVLELSAHQQANLPSVVSFFGLLKDSGVEPNFTKHMTTDHVFELISLLQKESPLNTRLKAIYPFLENGDDFFMLNGLLSKQVAQGVVRDRSPDLLPPFIRSKTTGISPSRAQDLLGRMLEADRSAKNSSLPTWIRILQVFR